MLLAHKSGKIRALSGAVPDSAFAKALRQMKTMTKTERVQSLKDAGIITAKGNYTKPYRIVGQSVSRAPRAAAVS